MMRRLAACVLGVVLLTGCQSRRVEKDLTITDVHTGWYDVGIVDGMNKIVPSITLRLKNVSGESISRVQINAVFRQNGDDKAWSAPFVRGIGPDGLAPGATGQELVLRGDRGYTSIEGRLKMLQHSQFVDARVQIFGKHGSRTWVKLGEFQIDRQLLTE
ncbi:MAG TPA: hypothetical protein VKB50_04050 [Vicinamibacterales bacterium]|nr:hypothetical protein [Vicinamibacterales bacterium]